MTATLREPADVGADDGTHETTPDTNHGSTARSELRRRELAKLIALGTGLGALQATLPTSWFLPEVAIGILPAHAEGSGANSMNEAGSSGHEGSGSAGKGESAGMGAGGNAGMNAPGMDASMGMDATMPGADSAVPGQDANVDDLDAGAELDAGFDASSNGGAGAGGSDSADANSTSNIPAPAGLVGTPSSNHSIVLTWTPDSNDFYDVAIVKDGETTPANAGTFMNNHRYDQAYTFDNLLPNTGYTVKLRGIQGCCHGPYATAHAVTFEWDTPQNLQHNGISGSVVSLSWDSVALGVSYRIERSMYSDFGYSEIGTSLFASFNDQDTKTQDQTYWYRVYVIDGDGNQVSGYSGLHGLVLHDSGDGG